MSARLIDGQAFARDLKRELADQVSRIEADTGRTPTVATVLVGEAAGARAYCKHLRRSSEEVGLVFRLVQLTADVPEAAVAAEIDRAGTDEAIHGILLQMPLPEGISARRMATHIRPEKDVEGITTANLGKLMFYETPELVPTTAGAAYELIKYAGCEIQGAECCVVGHSPIVGKPLAAMLTNDLGTCTICHIGTRDLAAHTREADILVVAVGKARLIGADHIRPGAIVIDVGINREPRTDSGGNPILAKSGRPKMHTVGDVDFEAASEVAGAITPVPGGVGPVTVAMLMRNVVRAAKLQLGCDW